MIKILKNAYLKYANTNIKFKERKSDLLNFFKNIFLPLRLYNWFIKLFF